MRKIIKPEEVRRDKRVVKIPDVDFKIEPAEDEEQTEEQQEEQRQKQELSDEYKKELAAKVRKELSGEVSRKKLKAKNECDKMLRDAKKEADAIIMSAQNQRSQILTEAQGQAAQLRQDAVAEGSKKGFEEKTQLLDNLAVYISHCLEEIKRERDKFFEQYAAELKHLAVEVCDKIIRQKIEDDDMIMYGVIKDALRYVRDVKWVKAEVSAELSGYIDTLEQELAGSGQNVEFTLTDGAPKDTCILNTSNGLVVATLSEQIKNLREFIDMLDKGESDEG